MIDNKTLVSENKDADFEFALRDVNGDDLESFADQLERIIGTRSPERMERLREHVSMTASPRRPSQHGDAQNIMKRRESFAPGSRSGTVRKRGNVSPERLPLQEDASSFPPPPVHQKPPIPTKPPVPAKPPKLSGEPMRLVGLRRESKILDRIRMFDGPVNFRQEKARPLTKGPAGSTSPNSKRLASGEKRPALSTPSAVRNSYVQTPGTKTPTRSGARVVGMWTPASRDTRSRKKVLYVSPQLQPQGKALERGQSLAAAIDTPQRVQPPEVNQIHSQHSLIQAWADQSPVTYRQERLKTPTSAAAIKGPDGFVALSGEEPPASWNRSLRNERIRRMTNSRIEFRDMIGKAIEAKVGSIETMDPAFIDSVRESARVEEDDGAPLLKRSPTTLTPSPLSPSPLVLSGEGTLEQDDMEPLLEKEMPTAPLKFEARRVKQTYQCCANGSTSRNVSHDAPPEKQCNESHAPDSEIGSPEVRRASKLAHRITMFEKVSENSPQKTQTLAVSTTIWQDPFQTQENLSPIRNQSVFRARVKTPFEGSTDEKSRNAFVNRQRRKESRPTCVSPLPTDDGPELPKPGSQEIEIIVDMKKDEPELSPTRSPKLDAAIFKLAPKFKTQRVIMPHTVVPSPPEEQVISPKFNTKRITMPHTVARNPEEELTNPVNIKSCGSLMARIKTWENRSAMQNTGPTISRNAVSKIPSIAARSGMGQFSNGKRWIRAASAGKTLSGKVATMVEDVGREMKVPVVSRDAPKMRSAWEEKERTTRKEDATKSLNRVTSKFHDVSGLSSRSSRRSTIADIPISSENRGMSLLLAAAESVATDSDNRLLSEAAPAEAAVSSVSNNPALVRQSRRPGILSDFASAGDGSLSDPSNGTSSGDEICDCDNFESSNLTERFMKDLRAGRPRLQPESTTTMSPTKNARSATLEIQKMTDFGSPGRNLSRYSKMRNTVQKGKFVVGSGGNGGEEAVFACDLRDTQTPAAQEAHSKASDDGKGVQATEDVEGIGSNRERSWWSATTESLPSSASSDADDVGLKRLGRDSEQKDGDENYWLGPKISRSRSTGSGTKSNVSLQSSEALEVDSSSGSDIGPLRQISSSSASASLQNNLVSFPTPFPTLKVGSTNPQEQKKSGHSSMNSETTMYCSDTDIDEDEFEVVEGLEGPMLLGKRVQSGMLVEPRPVRLMERERLVKLCCSPEKWGKGSGKGEKAGSSGSGRG